jgi:hypothetical protein
LSSTATTKAGAFRDICNQACEIFHIKLLMAEIRLLFNRSDPKAPGFASEIFGGRYGSRYTHEQLWMTPDLLDKALEEHE